MILSRKEFMKLWLARQRHAGRAPNIRVTRKHTHIDSFYTQITEGYVGAVALSSDRSGDGVSDVNVCIGGDGRHGNGCWVKAFPGTSTTSLGLSRHLEITVELIDE